MKLNELLLLAVAGWCGIGAIGIGVSLFRGRRQEATRHGAWLAAVAVLYVAAVLAVSAEQKQKLVPMGKDQCFDEMCFAVVGVDETPGLVAGEDSRVIRVAVRVTNHSNSSKAEGLIAAYLVDAQGRVWEPLAGLSGNPLNGRVAGGSQMLSQPMFRVAGNSSGLGLVFTHGPWQPGRLVIGDTDSLLHKRTVAALGR
jgi:hypothetical protein